MTEFLLDANAAIAIIRRRPLSVGEQLIVASDSGDAVAISSVALAELHFGAAKSQQPNRSLQSIDKLLAGGMPVIAFEEEDAACLGQLRAALERNGTPIGSYDLMIAAQAVRRGMVVVTNNVREFERVENLSIVDWST